MTNRSKTIGTKWESAIVKTLNDELRYEVERRALTGANDRGDIAGVRVRRGSICIEAKAEKSYSLGTWIGEVTKETLNAAAWIGVVWAKRVGKTDPLDGYVVMTGRTWLRILEELDR